MSNSQTASLEPWEASAAKSHIVRDFLVDVVDVLQQGEF
jgi:hypothetical protein